MKHLLASLVLIAAIGTPVAALAEEIVASGEFRDIDSRYTGSGIATLVRNDDGTVQLNLTDFETIDGPDLKVWLVTATDIQNSQDVIDTDYLALGKLQSPQGNQTYAVPEDIDLSVYNSAIIWCEAFTVLFTTADLVHQ